MDYKILQSKAIAISRDHSLLANFAIVLALITIAPLFQNQIVTGSIVNALLIISVFLCGFSGAFLLIFIPSMISLFLGLLPSGMMLMIPFIFIGNAILVLNINAFKNRYWLGAIIGVFAKAAFLFASSYLLLNFFTNGISAKVASSMMGYLQLLTASVGAIIAYGTLKVLNKI
ncbi:MAG: iron hydrogenase [Candidatus Paceibacterota bacterium]